MDNNQNFQPQQQQPAQPQQPVNNMYQQQFQQPPMPPKFNVLELVSIICSGVGFLMVVFGTIFTCTCSATKWSDTGKFSLSAMFILTIFGIIVCAAGIVLAIMAIKQTDAAVKAGKIAKLAMIVGAAGAIFGILPLVTICGYNCSLNNTEGGEALGALSGLSDSLFK